MSTVSCLSFVCIYLCFEYEMQSFLCVSEEFEFYDFCLYCSASCFLFHWNNLELFYISKLPKMTQHKFIYDLRNESNPIDCFKVIFWYSIWYFGRKLIKAFCCQFIHSNAKLREKRSNSRLDHTHAKPKKGSNEISFIHSFYQNRTYSPPAYTTQYT